MFFLEDNASKIILWALMDFLNSKGIEMLDIQMVTPILGYLGGKEIERELFLEKLPSLINNKKKQDLFKDFKYELL